MLLLVFFLGIINYTIPPNICKNKICLKCHLNLWERRPAVTFLSIYYWQQMHLYQYWTVVETQLKRRSAPRPCLSTKCWQRSNYYKVYLICSCCLLLSSSSLSWSSWICFNLSISSRLISSLSSSCFSCSSLRKK